MMINIKGIPFWKGDDFVISETDLFVTRETLEEMLRQSMIVLEYAAGSVVKMQQILGQKEN